MAWSLDCLRRTPGPSLSARAFAIFVLIGMESRLFLESAMAANPAISNSDGLTIAWLSLQPLLSPASATAHCRQLCRGLERLHGRLGAPGSGVTTSPGARRRRQALHCRQARAREQAGTFRPTALHAMNRSGRWRPAHCIGHRRAGLLADGQAMLRPPHHARRSPTP